MNSWLRRAWRPSASILACFIVAAYLAFLLPGRSSATEKPSRILSASLAGDEMLTEILQASCLPEPCTAALSRLVAFSKFADDARYSNILSAATSVKGRFSGDLEQLVSLRPDLVVVARYSRPEIIARLQTMKKATLLLDDPFNLEAIKRSILTIGERIGEPIAATKVLARMEADLEQIKLQAQELKEKKSRCCMFTKMGALAVGILSSTPSQPLPAQGM